MKNQRPIYWHQGLFLQPQHFQLADLHTQSLLEPLGLFVNPYLWGVGRLAIEEKAMAEKSLVISQGSFIFPDGTWVEFPGNAVIQPRSFEESLLASGKPFKVYLGLRRWEHQVENVTVVQSLDDLSAVKTRFVTTAGPEEVQDLYGSGPAAQVKRMSYVPTVFWETEKDQLSKYHLIPIALVEPKAEGISLAADFAPPALTIDASAPIAAIIKDLFDKVSSRCRRLEEYKISASAKGSMLEPGVFFLVMGLRTLSRHILPLQHLITTPGIHPWRVYGQLLSLLGELTTFSQSLNAKGEQKNGKGMVPPYKHEDLYGCFSLLRAVIGRLLDDITFGPESVIRLDPEDSYYVGKMEQFMFSDRNVYYLAVSTAQDRQMVLEAMKSLAKLSAKENLNILVTRALPGLGLAYEPLPPAGLPQLTSVCYFRIDVSSTQWQDVQRLGNIALYWDVAPKDMVAEVIVARRT